jgi:hypothetical protein
VEHPESHIVKLDDGSTWQISPAIYTTPLHGCRRPSCGCSRQTMKSRRTR